MAVRALGYLQGPAGKVWHQPSRTRRHLFHAQEYRREMASRFSTWNDVTGLTTTA